MLTAFLDIVSWWLPWAHACTHAHTHTPAHTRRHTGRHQLLQTHIHPHCTGPGGRNPLSERPVELGKG